MRSVMTIGLIVLLSGCSNTMWTNKPTVPETSRTAVVHDVRVSMTDIVPSELRVTAQQKISRAYYQRNDSPCLRTM